MHADMVTWLEVLKLLLVTGKRLVMHQEFESKQLVPVPYCSHHPHSNLYFMQVDSLSQRLLLAQQNRADPEAIEAVKQELEQAKLREEHHKRRLQEAKGLAEAETSQTGLCVAISGIQTAC